MSVIITKGTVGENDWEYELSPGLGYVSTKILDNEPDDNNVFVIIDPLNTLSDEDDLYKLYTSGARMHFKYYKMAVYTFQTEADDIYLGGKHASWISIYANVNNKIKAVSVINGLGQALSCIYKPSSIYAPYEFKRNSSIVNYTGLTYYPYVKGFLFQQKSVSKHTNPDTDDPAYAAMVEYLLSDSTYANKTDPYDKGGTSGTGGGDGNFDRTNTGASLPALPSLSAIDSGFISVYQPTLAQLKQLYSFMWSSTFYDSIAKLWSDPMNCIMGLNVVPTTCSTTSTTLKIGNVDTGIGFPKISNQFVTVDCGSITVNKYWGSYLDYSPYTKAEIYLPYIGIQMINVDDIMGKSIHVVYHIDVVSCACTAFIECNGSVLYEFTGCCGYSIPLSGSNFMDVYLGAMSVVAGLTTTVATGGMSAPVAATAIASTASTVANSKPQVQRSGAVSGSSGYMGIQIPYLILTYMNQCVPESQNEITGYPSYISAQLSSLSGYTKIEEIHLDCIDAFDNEINEIHELLQKGVIL